MNLSWNEFVLSSWSGRIKKILVEAAGCCNHIQDDRGTYPHRGVLSPGPHESGGVVSGSLATYGLGCGFINNNDENKKKEVDLEIIMMKIK